MEIGGNNGLTHEQEEDSLDPASADEGQEQVEEMHVNQLAGAESR